MTLINNLIQFQAGTKALSSEINANFETIRVAHNDADTRLTTAETDKMDKSGGVFSGNLRLNGIFAGKNSYDKYCISLLSNDSFVHSFPFGLEMGPKGYLADFAIVGAHDADVSRFLHFGYHPSDNPANDFISKVKINTYTGEIFVGSSAVFHEANSVRKNHLAGLELSNNVSSPNVKIDISAGSCMDLTNTATVNLSAITKDLSSSWAAGTGNGGLDAGNKANNTWYHVFAISKADGTADALFSTSATTPAMPANYSYKRRIGSIKTDNSGNITAFKQNGDVIEYITPFTELSTSGTVSATPANLTLNVPPGAITRPIIGFTCGGNARAANGYIYDLNAGRYTFNVGSERSTSVLTTISSNTSSQIAYAGDGGNFSAFTITNYGYIDLRGKN